ncbi:unnamed protein product [Brachionus calyciflorus]|uniref:Uncharacterized protein n=1 Tax=Brachionus calyciflorus TaxID=104777 RepID=A0A813N7X5_9BILA|nr:unnamed protein product [Brachionus calyciflorus]
MLRHSTKKVYLIKGSFTGLNDKLIARSQRLVLDKTYSSWKEITNIGFVDNETDSSKLQEDIKSLYEKSKQWLMNFNENKYVVMHYGLNNQNYEYSLSSHKLTESHQERDLGVIFSKDLKNSAQVAVATRRANYTLSIN